MTPTIGRIVHYTFPRPVREAQERHDGDTINAYGQSATVPATIVCVFSDTLVNLRVHPDGPGLDLWETSVPMKIHEGDHYAGAAYWEWPPRV